MENYCEGVRLEDMELILNIFNATRTLSLIEMNSYVVALGALAVPSNTVSRP